MSYKNTHIVSNTRTNNIGDIYFNDESIININKTRFHEFYYEELDKLNKKYYNTTPMSPGVNQIGIDHQSINEDSIQSDDTKRVSTQPINIYTANTNNHRYRLNSLNNLVNSPPVPSKEQNELNLSMSPFGINSTGTNMTDSQKSISQNVAMYFNPEQDTKSALSDINLHIIELHTPSPSHKMIVKRVYDNHLSLNIDNLQNTSPINNYNTNILYDFISDELNFLSELLECPVSDNKLLPEMKLKYNPDDPFELINTSTVGLLFDRMNKCKFSFRLAYQEIMAIINELSHRYTDKKQTKSPIKQSILDTAIGILQNSANELLQPGLAIDQVLVKSLGEFIYWIYSIYGTYYWMPSTIANISYTLATELSARFGIKMVAEIYKTIRLYFIPSYLFSVSRMAWKFTNIHRRAINNLRSIIIPPSSETYWIIKCLEQSRNIHWVHHTTPHIKNIIVFIDGRNWFYSEEHVKTSGGINLELLRQFITLSEYQNLLADIVYGRITQLMTSGRQLPKKDPAFIIPVLIFNEKHRPQIQPLIQQHHTHNTHNTQNIIYTPRGQNDDLMTLYLWLSNPGSFIASNDNFGDHAARIAQYPIQSKYFEGLWVELIRCFKLLNPFTTRDYDGGKYKFPKNHQNLYSNNQIGCSAPF